MGERREGGVQEASCVRMSFLFGSPLDISIEIEPPAKRKLKEVLKDDKIIRQPVFFSTETVKGKIRAQLKPGKKVEHVGIRVEFLGQVGTLCFALPNGRELFQKKKKKGFLFYIIYLFYLLFYILFQIFIIFVIFFSPFPTSI